MDTESEHPNVSRILTWRLRNMIVERGINTAAELQRRLAAIGYHITDSQVTRIVKERPVEVKTVLLDALIEVLACDIQDIMRADPVDPSQTPSVPKVASTKAIKGSAKTAKTRRATGKGAKAAVVNKATPPRIALVPTSLTTPEKNNR